MNKTSQKFTFIELLDKYSIEIPIIQRDYAQGREDQKEVRKNFLDALFKAVNNEPLELDFVYGSVKDQVLQPLDGQQRLTTLFLLHWFIATQENKLDDELKKQLSKFTYETRVSSREFCQELVKQGIQYVKNNNKIENKTKNKKNKKISEQIIDSPWFFLAWKKDPTIKAMLTMLDAIEEKFKEKQAWEKLNNIQFYFIELEHFGLSDDLYIKMNARGKLLTEFENFKAKFEQHINQEKWEKNLPLDKTFSYLIDTQWADLFWNYRDKKTNTFDQQIMNFFKTFAIIHYALKANRKDVAFENNISSLLYNSQKISFEQYKKWEILDKSYFNKIKSILNKISEDKKLKTFLPTNTPYINEKGTFEKVIENKLFYPDLVMAYAYYEYIHLEENIDEQKFQEWMRVVRNLVEGSRPYLFYNAYQFSNALLCINRIIEHRNNILEYFANEKPHLSGLLGIQVEEEHEKAKLILKDENWRKAIIEIENHGYFNGQIGFLLDWCKNDNNEYDLAKFKEYAEKAKAIFDNDGLKPELDNKGDFILKRALLAIGDYLLYYLYYNNYTFLVNNHRNISWKRLLRDDNQGKRNLLKDLLDKIRGGEVNYVKEDLNKIIDNFSDNDWRYYFIKQPEMIGALGTYQYIRKESDKDILLLSTTTTSGYHKEYYSYSLFIELKNELKLKDNDYKKQCSTESWKYFEVNGKKISYNWYPDKYVWTEIEDTEWKEFASSREEAIEKILEFAKQPKLSS
ncbi:MAG: hypothetical protein KatS3mg035_0242 [Bacteroidia bacterium]|nr:MAG: hypothetical protein KatS3mg035_0242 [Bacteroidia bacterium]